jgi:hypothetical protein
MIASRAFLGLLAALAVTACGAPSVYTKTGASEEVAKADLGDCRTAARDESWRSYGFGYAFGPGPWAGWGFGYGGGYGLWRQRLSSDRYFEEGRLTDFCMRNKGYTLTPAPEA